MGERNTRLISFSLMLACRIITLESSGAILQDAKRFDWTLTRTPTNSSWHCDGVVLRAGKALIGRGCGAAAVDARLFQRSAAQSTKLPRFLSLHGVSCHVDMLDRKFLLNVRDSSPVEGCANVWPAGHRQNDAGQGAVQSIAVCGVLLES